MNQKENSSRKKEVQKTCLDWAKSSTFNGLANFLSQNSIIIRVLWFLFMLISFVLCLIQIIEMFQEYFKYEVKSKISLINEVPSIFPIIVMCNVNFLSSDYAASYAQNIISNYANSSNQSFIIQEALKKPYVQKYLVQANAQTLNETEKRKLGSFGYELNTTIVKCFFEDTLCNLTKDFDWYFDSNNGNCLKFNANQAREVYSSELKNGLEMEIYIGDGDEKVDFSITRGLRIFLIDNPNRSLKSSIELPASMSTNIEISKVLIERLSKPYSECRPFSMSDNYSQVVCKHQCYQENLIKICSCYDTRFTYLKTNFKPCIEINEILCSIKFYNDFNSNLTKKQNCDSKCPDECVSTKYDFKLSMANFPTERYANYLINESFHKNKFQNMDYETLKKSLISFKIYFDDLVYTNIKEQPGLSENDLKSNIGGALSLYIGISIVSLGQFAEIFIKIILIFCKKIKPELDSVRI